MSNLKKRSVSLILFFSILFSSTIGFYFHKQTEAEAFALTLTTGSILACIGTAILGAGVIWHHKNDIAYVSSLAYNELKTQTDNINTFFKSTALIAGGQLIQMTKDGIDSLSKVVSSYKTKTLNDTTVDVVSSLKNENFSVGMPSLMGSMHYGQYYWTHNYYNVPVEMNFSDGSSLTWNSGNSKAFSGIGLTTDGYCKVRLGGWWTDLYADKKVVSLSVGNQLAIDNSVCVSPPIDSLKDFNESISSDNVISETGSIGVIGNVDVNDEVIVDGAIDDLVGVSSDTLVQDVPWVGTIDTDIDTDIPSDTDTPSDTTIPDFTIPTDVTLDFSPLYVSFAEKFPFCIPFDLINSIKSFSVARQTPKFEINFDSNYFTGGGSFTIDFTKFSTIAGILRYFILLTFIVSLIKITRELIKG